MTRKAFFAFTILTSLILSSCSMLLNHDSTGSLSFSISSDMVSRLKNASARALDTDTAATDGEETMFLDIELKGGYNATKTISLTGGGIVLFEEIPVGAKVKAEGTAYIVLHEKKHIFYKGETDEIVIEEGENQLALLMKPYEETVEDNGDEPNGSGSATLIGVKESPTAVGDIVFNDGSAIAYSSSLTLTDEQKAAAIAVIFYVGTDCSNNGENRILGVGLKQSTENLKWCTSTASAYENNISIIQCAPDNNIAGAFTFENATDKDGSDNLEQIGSSLASNDTSSSANYPAFYFAKNYSTTATNIVDTDYATGWYLPSFAELFQIYKNLSSISNAISRCDGTSFDTSSSLWGYWSSSQVSDSTKNKNAYVLKFYDGSSPNSQKDSDTTIKTCAIRDFSNN